MKLQAQRYELSPQETSFRSTAFSPRTRAGQVPRGPRGLARMILERAISGYIEELPVEIADPYIEIGPGVLRVHGRVADESDRETVILSLQGIAAGFEVEDHLLVGLVGARQHRESFS